MFFFQVYHQMGQWGTIKQLNVNIIHSPKYSPAILGDYGTLFCARPATHLTVFFQFSVSDLSFIVVQNLFSSENLMYSYVIKVYQNNDKKGRLKINHKFQNIPNYYHQTCMFSLLRWVLRKFVDKAKPSHLTSISLSNPVSFQTQLPDLR